MKKMLYAMCLGVIGLQGASQFRDVQQAAIDFDRAYKAECIDRANEEFDANNLKLKQQRDEEAARRAAAQKAMKTQEKSATSYLGGSQSLYERPDQLNAQANVPQQQQERRTGNTCCSIQ